MQSMISYVTTSPGLTKNELLTSHDKINPDSKHCHESNVVSCSTLELLFFYFMKFW